MSARLLRLLEDGASNTATDVRTVDTIYSAVFDTSSVSTDA